MVGDITRPDTYEAALASCTHLVILSSAVPKMLPTANPDDPPVRGGGRGGRCRPGGEAGLATLATEVPQLAAHTTHHACLPGGTTPPCTASLAAGVGL